MNILRKLAIQSQSHGELAAINPASEKVIAKVNVANDEQYQAIMQQTQRAFQTWRQVPAPKRGEYIRLIAEQLRAKKDYLGTLVSMETGKLKQEGDGEVQEMIDMADFAVGLSRMLYGKSMHSERIQHRLYEQWHPLGPIGVITAFNFPVAVWAWNAFIAAVCGNTVVWKPSSKVPLSALAVHHICQHVGQQLGYENIFSLLVAADETLATRMVDDPALPLISFTGSTAVGRKVAERVAKRLGRSLLELSGNNAIIIDETADLSLAIPAIIFGLVGTTGQRCTSTRRLIVHTSRQQEVEQSLIHALQQIKIGDPLKPDVTMGPLIDQTAVERYQQTIARITELGGDILHGGNILKQPGYFVTPALVRASSEWDVVQRETFAPILYLMSYEKIEQAVAMNNAVSQGLTSAIFSQNLSNVEYFLSAVGSDCGLANVNIGTSGAEIGGAFGGEKDTGGGREAGSDSWKHYMRRQTVTINWGKSLPLAQGIEFDVPD